MYILWQGTLVAVRYVRCKFIVAIGLGEAERCWHLELRIVQKSNCWGSMDRLDDGGCYCSQVCLNCAPANAYFSRFLSNSTVRRLRELTEA
jgi:hypothetical protein